MTCKHSHAIDVINKMFLFSQDYGISEGLDKTLLKGRDVSALPLSVRYPPEGTVLGLMCGCTARLDSFIKIIAGSHIK